MDSSSIMLACFIAALCLMGLIAILGGFLHYRRERLLTHAERMKALEMGQGLPDDSATARLKVVYDGERSSGDSKSLAVQCYTTTGWVAGLGLMFAAGSWANPGVAYAIAAGAGAIGVTGMICGTILAAKASEPVGATSAPAAPIKPRFDPEAV